MACSDGSIAVHPYSSCSNTQKGCPGSIWRPYASGSRLQAKAETARQVACWPQRKEMALRRISTRIRNQTLKAEFEFKAVDWQYDISYSQGDIQKISYSAGTFYRPISPYYRTISYIVRCTPCQPYISYTKGLI